MQPGRINLSLLGEQIHCQQAKQSQTKCEWDPQLCSSASALTDSWIREAGIPQNVLDAKLNSFVLLVFVPFVKRAAMLRQFFLGHATLDAATLKGTT